MKTIRLYGDMGKRFGREFRFDVASPAEAVRALCSQVKGFKQYLHEHTEDAFKVFAGGKNVSNKIKGDCSEEIIRITPTIQGAGAVARIILGIILIVVGVICWAVGGGYAVGMGIGLILGGVIEMLSPTPGIKSGTTSEAALNTPSFNFNGPVNTLAQGHPVSLCYGKLIVGSSVISAGLSTT